MRIAVDEKDAEDEAGGRGRGTPRGARRPHQAARRRLIGPGAGLIALMVAAPLVLTACSGSSDSATSASQAQRAEGTGGGTAQQDKAAPQAGGGATANGGSGSSASNAKLSNRSLIITAGLQVKTDDAAAAAQRAQIVAESAGGYVAGESIGSGQQSMPSTSPSGPADPGSAASPATLPDVSGSSNSTQALLVLRVPPQSIDSVLKALSGKGSVTYQSRNATDVTGQVADVASRVASAQAAIAELRTLIDKAASMNDLISLEQALSQRESDLESLEAQQKALSDQIQYATITVGYFSQGAPVAPPAVRTGFMKGLTVGWHGFLDVVRALLAAIGWLVPYLVVLAVLWWPVRRLVRLVRARGARPGKQEPEPEQAP